MLFIVLFIISLINFLSLISIQLYCIYCEADISVYCGVRKLTPSTNQISDPFSNSVKKRMGNPEYEVRARCFGGTLDLLVNLRYFSNFSTSNCSSNLRHIAE